MRGDLKSFEIVIGLNSRCGVVMRGAGRGVEDSKFTIEV